MSVIDQIEALKSYPAGTSAAFRSQLEMVVKEISSQRHDVDAAQRVEMPSRGIDRSKEFSPIARPSMVRSLAR